VLVVATFLVVGLHLPGLLAVWSDEPTAEYLATPTIFWIVKLMDLGVIVPVMVAVGVGLLRGTAWSRRAVYGMVAWLALLGASVAGMAISMQIEGDPSASLGMSVAFSLFAAVFLVLAVRVLRPLLGPASGSHARPAGGQAMIRTETVPSETRVS
jgi:hypothetical protein